MKSVLLLGMSELEVNGDLVYKFKKIYKFKKLVGTNVVVFSGQFRKINIHCKIIGLNMDTMHQTTCVGG